MLRTKNHLPVTGQVAADLLKVIDQSPAGFDLLIFKARIDDPEDTTGQDDPVGNLEAREKTLSYEPPVLSKAVMLPTEQAAPSMLAPGFDTLDAMDDPVQVVVKESLVPEQSVFWYEEQITEDQVKVTLLYVLRSEPIGINGQAGSIHWLMPFSQGVETLGKVPGDGLPQWQMTDPDKIQKALNQDEPDPQPEPLAEIPTTPDITLMGDLVSNAESPTSQSPGSSDNAAADVGTLADFFNTLGNTQ